MIARALRALPRPETAVIVGALVILVAVSLATQRRKDVTPAFDSYSSYDAASGGYRAFEALLVRQKIRTERFQQRPAFLDGALDTLVYAEPLPFDPRQQTLSRSDITALESWVRAGGRLLYAGYDDAAAKAGILALPATRLDNGERPAARAHRAARTENAFVAPSLAALGIRTLAATSSRRYVVSRRRARILVADARGPIVVTTPFGAGNVVAVVDRALFTNGAIATADRARLAVALARPGHRGGTVAFDEAAHGYVTPEHWWSIVPQRFLFALVLAGAALLVAFAGAAMRLGPPLLPAVRDDRTTFEFIEALSSLFARDGNVRETLHDAARSTSLTVTRALALPASASHDEIERRIERDDLRAAFREMNAIAQSGYAGERNLVRGVAVAQRLRKEFAAHGRLGN